MQFTGGILYFWQIKQSKSTPNAFSVHLILMMHKKLQRRNSFHLSYKGIKCENYHKPIVPYCKLQSIFYKKLKTRPNIAGLRTWKALQKRPYFGLPRLSILSYLKRFEHGGPWSRTDELSILTLPFIYFIVCEFLYNF